MAEMYNNKSSLQQTPSDDKKDTNKSVVKGDVTVKKVGAVEGFFKDDIPNAITNAKTTVIIPQLKRLGYATVTAIAGSIFGTGAASAVDSVFQSNNNTPYRSYSTAYNNTTPTANIPKRNNAAAPEVLYYVDEDDANAVLAAMMNELESKGVLSVADYIMYSGKDPEQTDFTYGWKSLKQARVMSEYVSALGEVRYWIKMPRPIPIQVRQY